MLCVRFYPSRFLVWGFTGSLTGLSPEQLQYMLLVCANFSDTFFLLFGMVQFSYRIPEPSKGAYVFGAHQRLPAVFDSHDDTNALSRIRGSVQRSSESSGLYEGQEIFIRDYIDIGIDIYYHT